MIVSLYLMPT